MPPWRPEIDPGEAPLYERLAAALARDVAAGRLRPGEKIPPQRDLAHRLNIGIGTVTRAYAEATRQGLLRAQVGSGSYVAETPSPTARAGGSALVDMVHNLVPSAAANTRLAETLNRLRRRPDLLDTLAYSPTEGPEAHRRAGAQWMRRYAHFADADWRRVICVGGIQQAMSLAFATLCRPGDTVLSEAATFVGLKRLAGLLDFRIEGLEMDREGVLPEALDRAGRAGARVAYLMPSLQNPTARVMGPGRRASIAAVARKHAMTIVEDDSYAIFTPPGVTPLAALAPERVWYMGGLSKALGPGLRSAFLHLPEGFDPEPLLARIQALYYAPSSFGPMIGAQWIEDGTAHDIVQAVRAELTLRLAGARRILGPAIEDPDLPSSPHLWLPLSELEAERVAARALRAGAELTPPSMPLVRPDLCSGLRLCLGAPADLATLERGLEAVRASLSPGADERARGLV